MYVKSGDGYFVKFEGKTPLMTTDIAEASCLSPEAAILVLTKLSELGYAFEALSGEVQTAVYRIDLSKKYLLVIEKPVSSELYERIKASWKDFTENGSPLMILSGMGDVKFIEVEVENE